MSMLEEFSREKDSRGKQEAMQFVKQKIDAAKWFKLTEARQVIKADSLAKRFLESFLDKHELGVAQVKGGIK